LPLLLCKSVFEKAKIETFAFEMPLEKANILFVAYGWQKVSTIQVQFKI